MRITLNGRTSADLDWKKEIQQARDTEERLVWVFDLGLFADLKYPLSHPSQYLSLRLAIEHFQNSVWSLFQSRTEAVVLYKGPLELLPSDYLDLLVQGFAEIPFCLELDAAGIEDPWREAFLRNRARFPGFQLHVSNSSLPLDEKANLAVILPPVEKIRPDGHSKLAKTIRELKKPFRLIPEEYFLLEWHGLDYVSVDPETIDLQLKRKLQGFRAAGGCVIILQDDKWLELVEFPDHLIAEQILGNQE